MRVIKSDADLTLTNQQQQTLLHTLVDPETYRLRLGERQYYERARYRRRQFAIIEAEEGDKKEFYVRSKQAGGWQKQSQQNWRKGEEGVSNFAHALTLHALLCLLGRGEQRQGADPAPPSNVRQGKAAIQDTRREW
jgi:hypothetical protein